MKTAILLHCSLARRPADGVCGAFLARCGTYAEPLAADLVERFLSLGAAAIGNPDRVGDGLQAVLRDADAGERNGDYVA